LEEQPYFMKANVGDFGSYGAQDEQLHPQFRSSVGTALVETHLFGFSVPDAAIHAFLYIWQHPNLGLVSGGALVIQGIKAHAPAAEISDFRHFMSDACMRDTFPNYRLDNGYEVAMLEQGKRFRTTYEDAPHQSGFDVVHTAVSEPIVWPGDKHFEQVMKNEGELLLRGKRYSVNGYHVRDRSWGQPRPEDPVDAPPHTWITGVFDDETAFHLTATDDPLRNPGWKVHYPNFDRRQSVKFGWLLLGGRKTRIKTASKLTIYDRTSCMPMLIDIEIVDEHDRVHRFKGTLVAGTPVHLWQNVRVPICLARWEYEGRVGWGDVQDVQYADYLLKNG
jgi:hypothetical protein